MALDQLLIEVLACPEDKGPLLWFEREQRLYNPRLRRSYEVRDGVPIMLIDEAVSVGPAEHDRLMAAAAGGEAVETGTGSETAGDSGSGESTGTGSATGSGSGAGDS